MHYASPGSHSTPRGLAKRRSSLYNTDSSLQVKKGGNGMKFERAETKHGAPLYVFPMPYLQSVAVGVLVFAGSRDEICPREAGLAHAFEHMVFQGNSRCGNSKEISEEVEIEGGMVNAWTSSEMTFYHCLVPDWAFEIAARSVASQVTSSLFRPEDVTKEMKNIVQEIRKTHDDPARYCAHLFRQAIFGSHPLGKRVLGSEETVSAFTRDDFLHWQERFYHAKNYVFLAAGNVMLQNAVRVFEGLPFRALARNRNARQPIFEIAGAVQRAVEERDIKQAHVCLGAAIGPATSRETRLLETYEAMIGGGMSSPLFQEVRDKRGLCYSIGANASRSTDRGTFRVSVGTDPNRLHEATDCIKEVLWSCRNDGGLLENAKRRIRGQHAISFSSPSYVLQSAAYEVGLSIEPNSPDEIQREIEGHTIEEVAAAVEKRLRPENLTHTSIVPRGTNA